MTADITLRGPDDVLAVLPYQLGYHPRDSVVVVCLRDGRMGLVARADLPPENQVVGASAALLGPVLRDRPRSAIIIGFEDDEHASFPMLLAVVEGLEREAVEVLDVLVVRDGRRSSPLCVEGCCPSEGVPVSEPADVPAVAEFILAGRSPLPRREDVEALVEPDPRACHGVAEAVGRKSSRPARTTDRRQRSARAWAAVLAEEPGAGPSPREVADLAMGLADIPWRDGVIAWLAPGVLPAGVLDVHVVQRLDRSLPRWAGMGSGVSGPSGEDRLGERGELHERLVRLCRAVPDECVAEAAAVCTLVAAVCWSDGDGALARSAVDRAIRLAPDYRLAQLLERVIDDGVRVVSSPDPGDTRSLGRAG